ADAACDLCIPLEAADHERQGGGTHRRKNLGILVLRDMPCTDQSRHGHCGIGDAAQPIGEAEIVHPCVACIEAWVNVDDRASLVRRSPERIEVGVVESAADAARQRADHGTGNPAAMAAISTLAARAPSPSGTVASATKCGSDLAAESKQLLASRL